MFISAQQLLEYAFRPLVAIGLCACACSIAVVVTVWIKYGFQRRFLAYLHIVPLLALNVHIYFLSPLPLASSATSLLYWSGAVGLLGTQGGPTIIEWKLWGAGPGGPTAMPRRVNRNTWIGYGLMWLVSVGATAVLFVILRDVAQLAEGL